METNKVRTALVDGDEFILWLLDELDRIDDQMLMEFSALKYIELKARKDALLEVRDAYVEKTKQAKETTPKLKRYIVEGE